MVVRAVAESRNRSAPPISEARVPSPRRRSAASDSRASCASRTATTRGSTGAPSSTTRAKAPERRRRSAHQGPRAVSGGRTIQRASDSTCAKTPGIEACAPVAQSRGSSVRVASTQATALPRRSVVVTSDRARVVLPSPGAARISVIRPVGIPPPGRRSSSRVIPVGRPGVVLGVPAMTAASCWRSSETAVEGILCDPGEGDGKGELLYRTKAETARTRGDPGCGL